MGLLFRWAWVWTLVLEFFFSFIFCLLFYIRLYEIQVAYHKNFFKEFRRRLSMLWYFFIFEFALRSISNILNTTGYIIVWYLFDFYSIQHDLYFIIFLQLNLIMFIFFFLNLSGRVGYSNKINYLFLITIT